MQRAQQACANEPLVLSPRSSSLMAMLGLDSADPMLGAGDGVQQWAAPVQSPMKRLQRAPSPPPSPPPEDGKRVSFADEPASEAASAGGEPQDASDANHHPKLKKRLSFVEARTTAIDRLSERGHRDRKTGTFGVPDEDLEEPARTERLLASPLAFHRKRAGDRFQSIEGYLLFRVNGTNSIGASYRLLVVVVNMMFGTLSGLAPLLGPGTMLALVQASCICTLQLAMSFVCFKYLPDADRIVSRFAGTQFLLEGLATRCTRARPG